MESSDIVDQGNSIDWKVEQQKDDVISYVLSCLSNKNISPAEITVACKLLWRERSNLVVIDGILMRKRICNGVEVHQLVLPKQFQQTALHGLHDEVGHFGFDKTLELIRDRFYWPGMRGSVSNYIANCKRCILRKSSTSDKAPLVNVQSYQPLDLVGMDFLSLEPAKGGVENVLVITDHFTRYAQAFPTRNQSAKTTAKVLYENFIIHYGFPKQLHSDQGRNFESRLIKEESDEESYTPNVDWIPRTRLRHQPSYEPKSKDINGQNNTENMEEEELHLELSGQEDNGSSGTSVDNSGKSQVETPETEHVESAVGSSGNEEHVLLVPPVPAPRHHVEVSHPTSPQPIPLLRCSQRTKRPPDRFNPQMYQLHDFQLCQSSGEEDKLKKLNILEAVISLLK